MVVNNLESMNYPKFKTSGIYTTLRTDGLEEEFPTLLFELLSRDGTIQVGEFIYYFDFILRKGYSINVIDDGSSYNDLITKNLSNPKVTLYNWTDEMIVWTNDPAAKLGCSENQAPGREDTKSYTDKIEWTFLLNGNVFQNTANASVNYKKFDGELKAKYRWTPGGWDLYTKVVIREKTQQVTGNSNGQITYTASWATANVPVRLQWQRRYKVKCRVDTGYQQLNNYGTGSAHGQSWAGLRACTKFILGANAYAQIDGNYVLLAFEIPALPVNGTNYQVRINHGY